MATYKEIKGVTVQTLDADPIVGGASWSSGGNLNEARYLMGAAGTYTASIAIGGAPPSPSVTDKTESYNGSSWTEVNDLNNARYWLAGLGTSTAAFAVGGDSPAYAYVESCNGSSLTETTDINTGRG